MKADDLLERIRAALGRAVGDVADDPPAIDDALVRRCPRDVDVAERLRRFAAAAAASGATCRVVAASDLPAALADHLAEGRRVAIGVVDEALAGIARTAVGGAGAEPTGDDRAHEAELGITDVEAAVAETGSIVVAGAPGRQRASWLLAPVHVAIVPASRIVADLLDLEPSHVAPGGASYRVLVTGPSKTADIEGELVTGVHGPGAVHLLVVTDR